jgi:hypothetical protein
MSYDMTPRELADWAVRRVLNLRTIPGGFAEAVNELTRAFEAHASAEVRKARERDGWRRAGEGLAPSGEVLVYLPDTGEIVVARMDISAGCYWTYETDCGVIFAEHTGTWWRPLPELPEETER